MLHVAHRMTSLINKSAAWSLPNYHKIVNKLTLIESVKITLAGPYYEVTDKQIS